MFLCLSWGVFDGLDSSDGPVALVGLSGCLLEGWRFSREARDLFKAGPLISDSAWPHLRGVVAAQGPKPFLTLAYIVVITAPSWLALGRPLPGTGSLPGGHSRWPL